MLARPKLIKSLEIRNVARIEHEVFEFGSLSRMEGENNAGKTLCTYVCLEIALLGDPFPEWLIRDGEATGTIIVTFTDGSAIERSRTGNKNSGMFTYADGTKKGFSTVKDMVRETQEFSGFSEVIFNKDTGKESFQFVPLDGAQVDVIFRADPATVLRRITKVVGGSGAETAKAALASKVRQMQAEKRVQQVIFETAETRLTEIWDAIDLHRLNEQFDRVSRLAADRDALDAQMERVRGLCARYAATDGKLAAVEAAYDPATVTKALAKLQEAHTALQQAETRLQTTQSLLAHRRVIEIRRSDVADAADRSEGAGALLKDLLEVSTDLDSATRKRELCACLVNRYEDKSAEIAELIIERQEVEQQISEYVAVAPTCPECGQLLPQGVAA